MAGMALSATARLAEWMASTTNPIPAASRLLLRLVQWRLERRTIKALQSLDDRILKDIGLDRSEICSVVREIGGQRRSGLRASK